jgi:hypothetical protein
MSNMQVVEAWAKNKPARTATLRTDGRRLWSFGKLVGYTGPEDEIKHVINWTARPDSNEFGQRVAGEFVSKSTSRHVSLARRVGYAVAPSIFTTAFPSLA